ncbi:ribose ABC transporter substrate-binding protein RbsB [Salisediminibacterium beveridgei]|uniref:Ribose ABC transport system, periplasmic ribose-binding protein RbsB n=1 Tax=Salisediminibacterium beveridgei TaxID=632773 RepID=A0A1D7QRZ8_9BACI|nr:ribose ABC transporter substrate-binding protein RbsB [Salisediminibacterium beveridgei]AOM81787.1 Ribose ABC transport system, periplasmic ribose-binding protein RbsB [Salisediminibacterium beveridgei]
MKKTMLVVVMMVFGFIVMACSTESPASNDGNNDADGGNEGSGEITVGFSISTLNNPFFVTLQEGAEAQADELGIELIMVDAQDDDAKQINDVEDLITQGVDVVLINPTDSTSVAAAVEAANSAGIPVVTVDRGADGGEVAAHIASDNVAGGEMAGELLVELVGEGAEVAELEGISGSSAARERGEGFNNIASDALTIVSAQTANFNRAEGLTVMENILQGNPDLAGVFAHNDEMALGALEAAEAAGRDDLIIIGFDATDDAVEAVESGRLQGTVAQQPTVIGEFAIDTALAIANEESVDDFIPVDLELVR